jgi:hypothetical protein
VAPDAPVWFAIFGSGVFGFDGAAWTHLSTAYGLAHNCFRAIDVAPARSDGSGFTLWFGFEGAGVARYEVPTD